MPLVPEREGEQPPDLAAPVLAALRRGRRGAGRPPPARSSPGGSSVSRERTSRANGSSSPRSQAAAGIEKPRLRPPTISAGRSGAAAARSSTFFSSRRTRMRRGSASAKSVTAVSRNGTRASSDHAIDARSVFTSRSSTRRIARSTSWSRASGSDPCCASVAAAQEVDRVVGARAPGERRPSVRREDLLPRVVALERRQVRAADEALRAVVEAGLRARGRQELDDAAAPRAPGARVRRARRSAWYV